MSKNEAVFHKDSRKIKAKDGRLIHMENGSGPMAFLDQVFTKVKPKKQEAAPNTKTPASVGGNPNDSINLLIAKNPEMNASTFYNLLKSRGFSITLGKEILAAQDSEDQEEADMSSSNVQALRKESNHQVGFKSRIFLESATPVSVNKSGTTRYKVVMLEEGMGNFGAAAYYSREALESAIPIFEGKKIYADHPAESEAEERPERSVHDILGHFENVHVAEGESGQSLLCADLIVMGGQSFQWARELMEHAVEYAKKFPDKEFVGLSINASGDSQAMPVDDVIKQGVPAGAMPKIQEAKNQGIETLTYVSAFTGAISCDLVTEAGAGGAILSLIEGAKMQKKKAVKESAKKEMPDMTKEADGAQGDDQKKSDADAGSDDASVMKKMMAKHMGEEAATPEEESIVKEAMEAHKEMGMNSEEAAEKACDFMKASKHMAAKREAAKVEADKVEAAKVEAEGMEAAKDADADDKKVKESASPSEIQKLKEANAKLQGELASFKESEKMKSLQNHVEKLCKESKLQNAVTADFKKLVETAKSVEEVDKTWRVFQEGYRARKSATEGALDFTGMMIDAEKAPFTESAATGLNFDACVIEN